MSSSNGFTLIELMVVSAIITVIMSIVFASQGSFNKSLILSNTAYDMALTIRSAETYGLSSRGAGSISNAGYGVHFSKGDSNSFILFADTYPSPNTSNCHGLPAAGVNSPDAQYGDCSYNSNHDQKINEYEIGNNIIVNDFCAFSGSWSCAYANGGSLSSLDIVFSRPNPDAFISENGLYSKLFPRTAACISVTSPQGGFRYISIKASGAITGNATSCP